MSSSEATLPASARRRVPSPAPALHGRPVHSSAFRATVRAVPLRSVQLAPAVRRTPTVTVVPEPERRPVTGLRDLTRRIATWGGGSHGEYLAWPTPEPPRRAALRPRLRALTRRVALWGAGSQGEHLAWGGPASAPRLPAPAVLPTAAAGTSTTRSAASSPAVVPRPARTLPAPGTGPDVLRAGAATPVVAPLRGWPQPPVWRTATAPVGAGFRRLVLAPAPARAAPGRTVPAARSPSTEARAGPARARGDPFPRLVRRPALVPPG